MDKREETRQSLIEHYRTYPKLQIGDILKFLYQSSFGCEHLLSDPSAAIDYIREEAARCHPHVGEWIEPLDGEYCRVHLDYLGDGLSAKTFGKLFFLSAEHNANGRELLEEKISVMLELSREGALPFSEEEARDAVEKWRKNGYPACHHSERFRDTYFPAYRVIKKEYAPFLPLLARIDPMLEQGRVTLAIEGGSASGKTTLGKLLEQVYGCAVFHMDDFFLRPEQRTPERFAEPGGNADRERFLTEVLLPLSKNEQIRYSRFDCSTFTLLPATAVMPTSLNVVEGAYSMHPDLAEYYDLSVFLDVSPAQQEKRIRKRNSPELTERFFSEWIPMERRYFDIMNVKERCDIQVSIRE